MEAFILGQEIIRRIDEIDVIYQFIGVFLISLIPFLEAFVAVPIGILLNLPFIPVIIIGATGNWLSVMAVIVSSTYIRTKFSKGRELNANHFITRRLQKANTYFNKYGVPGISLLGPVIGTNHIVALACLIGNANTKKIVLWQSISIVIWAIGTGVLLFYGVDIYNTLNQ